MQLEECLTAEQAARELGVSLPTFRRALRDGRIPRGVSVFGRTLFDRAVIESLGEIRKQRGKRKKS